MIFNAIPRRFNGTLQSGSESDCEPKNIVVWGSSLWGFLVLLNVSFNISELVKNKHPRKAPRHASPLVANTRLVTEGIQAQQDATTCMLPNGLQDSYLHSPS